MGTDHRGLSGGRQTGGRAGQEDSEAERQTLCQKFLLETLLRAH